MGKYLWLCLLCLFAAKSGFAGPRDSGGGDEVGLEFHRAMETAIANVQNALKPKFPSDFQVDWPKAVKGVSILVTDDPLYVNFGGITQESIATNEPSTKIIRVNRIRWKQFTDLRLREGIALHEILSLAGLESTGRYPYSGLYVATYGYAPESMYGSSPNKVVGLPKDVSRVYSYRCRKRFFEGEGVSQHEVSCPIGQRLGFLFAEYTFALFENEKNSNFHQKGKEVFYESALCGLAPLSKFSCDFSPRLEFGLSAESSEDFPVGISLTAGPEGKSSIYGFAALPNSSGNCPAPLVSARPYMAQPSSVIDPLPSNFINSNNNLNNTIVATSDSVPRDFQVWRQPASKRCGPAGICPWPSGEMVLNQSIPYMMLTPKVCVIPRSELR